MLAWRREVGMDVGGQVEALRVMIDETIRKIENRIQRSVNMDPDRKRELLELITTLRQETVELSKQDLEQAESIASFVDLSTHEATRSQQQPALLKNAVDGLSSTVEGFEKEHPRLVEAVNRISYMLANMGI
jgi:hypothetical protein